MFNLVDSLYHVALTRVCLNFFNRRLLTYSLCLPGTYTVDVRRILRRKVMRSREIPEPFEPDFFAEIQRLAKEIETFCNFACRYVDSLFRFADHVAWNGEGNVDVLKTFVSAVRNGADFDLAEKFKLACAVCDDDSLRLVKETRGFARVEAAAKLVADPVYDFYLWREDAFRTPKEFYERAVYENNVFALKFFLKRCPEGFRAVDCDTNLNFLRTEETTARFFFSNSGVEHKHRYVHFAMPYYRKRDRFRRFRKDFWDELDPSVKTRTLSLFGNWKHSNTSFQDYDDEEVLFFVERLNAKQQKRLLDEMERTTYFKTKLQSGTEFVARLLRACGKENARVWLDSHRSRMNPLMFYELLSQNLI